MDISKCRSCGAPIRWVKTRDGKNMPLDLPPVPPATPKAWVMADLRTARPATEDDLPELVRWRPHWATCPNADQHRKRGAA